MRNWKKAFFLVCYAPKFVWDTIKEYAEKYKKNIVLGSAIIGVLFVCLINLNWKSCGGELHIVDVSAAFSTGQKRTMQVELVAIHHTAGSQDDKVNDLARYQLYKFGVVAYHFLVMPDGTIYQLRPLDERVPHAYGCNDNAVAVCLVGNFDNYPVPEAQRMSALQLVRWLMEQYGLKKENVMAHRELINYSPQNVTDCCGKMFNIEKFRKDL